MKRALFIPFVFAMEIRRIFSYRLDFWISFIGSLLAQFGVAWFLWQAVYTYKGLARVGPFSFRGMMLYYLLVPIVGRAVRGAIMEGVAQEIYDGTLNRYLIYPVSYFAYKFSIQCAHMVVFTVQGMVAVCIYLALFGFSEFQVTPFHFLMAVVGTLLANLLHFAVVCCIELTAFWADNVWSLSVIVRFITGLLGGGMLPLALFPDWLEPVLVKLPFYYFMSFPVRCLQGRIAPFQWLADIALLIVWIVLFTLLFRRIWNAGKYKYTGVGI